MQENHLLMDSAVKTQAWNELYRRLKVAHLALERDFTTSEDVKRRILRLRAQALAHVPAAETRAQKAFDLVEFRLAAARYGIAAAYVREVFPLCAYTPLPCTLSFVYGIINVRGQILSILDMKQWFDLPACDLPERNHVMVVYNGQMEFCLLADAVLGVRDMPLQDVHPTPPALPAVGAKYVQGITEEGIIVLDAQKLLSDDHIIVHEEVEM